MPQSFDNVFTDWKSEKCLGIGTDGRVYLITRQNEDGSKEQSILKTIRVSSGRNESRNYNSISQIDDENKSSYVDDVIDNIISNIKTIQRTDGGKRFVKYEQFEVRPTSDGKGKVILIKLEMMKSLTQLLNQFSFTLEETVRLGISICKSLIRCRDFGYIYPNLKPDNILFDKRGVCKLADFGSFSLLEPSKTSIAYKKTEYYMAPELIVTNNINCTCDTYSLGLVLYTLTNRGRLPFVEKYPQEVTLNGLDRSKYNRINGETFPKADTASDALMQVIRKACARKESDRYLSPRQMLADLNNVLQNKPLGNTSYEDIYSHTEKKREETYANMYQEKLSDSLNVDEEIYEPFEEEYKKPVSLRDEIPVPDVSPFDYVDGEPIRKIQRTPTYRALPKKISKKSTLSADTKKLAALIIAIIAVFILLIISLTLRSASGDEQYVSQTLSQGVIYFGEMVLNGI